MLSQKWDLDVIFPGGSSSPELETFLNQLEADIASFKARVAATAVPATTQDLAAWSSLLADLQDLAKRNRQVAAFVSCLNAQNTKDEKAKLLSGRLGQIGAAFGSASTLLDAQILALPDGVFAALVEQP
ncbi:MAG TPA: oligoendopeptidase, partial [Symbiobacteriaceae bacterium]|nr:oligoendopeptidase [Symbiobacteriaceae bacterium]